MLKKIGSLIQHRNKSLSLRPLTRDQVALLNVFTQNLDLFQNINTDKEQVQLFETLLAQFKDTFDPISYEQIYSPQVVEAIDKYCKICTNVGANIITDIKKSEQMFDTILFIFHMFSKLPHDTEFIALFIEIIHEAKKSPEILRPAYDVITLMFNSQNFYNNFVENDGFTLIFTTFYSHFISDQAQTFFNRLLFESIPKDYHVEVPPQSLLNLFTETFIQNKGTDLLRPACAKFVSNYLLVFHHVDPSVFNRFNDLNGFAILNHFFIHCYQIESVELYKKFLMESGTDPCIVTNLYKLYRDEKSTLGLRTSIIKLLTLTITTNNNNGLFSFEKLNEIVPIHLWILFPPQLDSEALIHLTIFLKDLSESRRYSIKPALDAILKIIQPPGDVDAPIDSFLELIETAINQAELKPEELLSKKFLEDFILIPSVENVARYFDDHELFGSVVASVYSSESASDYRYPIIQKFIEVSQYLKDMKDFIGFLATLFTRHFSAQIVSLLLNFMENKHLNSLLIKELTKRPQGFQFFMESNGFLSFDDFLKEHNDRGEEVVKLLSAISYFGPKKEINEWINRQPVNSPIYSCDQGLLQSAIYAFKENTSLLHIPAFLPFTDSFTPTMINAYLAGKYGVPAYKKFQRPIKDIPHYLIIADRFVDPDDIQSYLDLGESLINPATPHYSLYEFVPDLDNPSLTLPFHSFVFFSFCVPHFVPPMTPLVKHKFFNIFFEGDNLTLKNSKGGSFTTTIKEGKWHRMIFCLQPLKKKIDIIIDQNRLCGILIDDEKAPFIFGEEKGSLSTSFMLSKQILFSDRILHNFDFIWRMNTFARPKELSHAQVTRTNAVYEVHYQGFPSYFEHFIDVENLFIKLEKFTELPKFLILFDIVLKIQIVNVMNVYRFWDRMLLMIKRQRDLVKGSLPEIIFVSPTKYFRNDRKSRYINHLLNDIEIFFVFPIDDLKKLLEVIKEHICEGLDLEPTAESQLLQTITNLMRSGVDQKLVLAFIPILTTIINSHPTISKHRFLLNTSIVACDWNEKIDYSLPNYPIIELLSVPLPNNKIHYFLLEAFINLAKKCPDTELYTYDQLLGFMLLFDDERSFLFADLIAIYSNKNSKFVKDSCLGSFTFAQQCESIGCWIRAFAILSGQVSGDIFPTRLLIERPVFLPVVIEMLSSLCQKIATAALLPRELTTGKMVSQIFELILTLAPDHMRYFLQTSCQLPLMLLANLGMVPKTIQSTSAGESGRAENNWDVFTPNHLSKDELRSSLLLCDKVPPFTSAIAENEAILNAQTMPKFFKTIEKLPDNVENTDWIKKIPFMTSLLNLFSSILFQSEPSSFGTLLFDFVAGHSLMYESFSRFFGQELVFNVIVKMTISDLNLELYHKPLFRLISKCVKNCLFNDRYLHLLSLIFNMFKNMQIKGQFESILGDMAVMNAYREILLGAFIYLTENGLLELFQLFATYKKVLFYPPLFANNEFALFWIHVTRLNDLDSPDVILCMKLLLSMFEQPILSDYKAEEVGETWKLFKQRFAMDANDIIYTSRLKKAKALTSHTQYKYTAASKEHLSISIFRVANLYIQSNAQIFSLNLRNRNYESSLYQMNQTSQTLWLQKIFVAKSYHLAANPMPLYQSTAVLPSPYEIRSPEFSQKISPGFFAMEQKVHPSRIKQILDDGMMRCAPEWHHFHKCAEMFSSPFEYSQFINQKNLLPLFKCAYQTYGPFSVQFNVDLFYCTHPIPSVLLFSERAVFVLILAQLKDGDIELIEQPQWPFAYMPFAESVSLNEWHRTSLFCGHILLILEFDRILAVRTHLYLHKSVGISFCTLYDPPLIIIFKNQADADNSKKLMSKVTSKSVIRQIPNSSLLFTIPTIQKATELWDIGLLSNYNYLLLLNYFGGRSFSDLTQYPVFPWVVSPNLEQRDLSLPMGQLDKDRAEHYNDTFEGSGNKYFYGCHYSFPCVVSWLLLRLPPYTFFQWDLNNGWDDSQRLFLSVVDAYKSASSSNQMDLKELIPAMYSVPEAFVNISNLVFVNDDSEFITLPDWAGDSPQRYVDVMRKFLENSEDINNWIDLIFGFKETGEAALQAKNVFLPSSYHSASPESAQMEQTIFEMQCMDFGQCPIQLFTKPHPQRTSKCQIPLTILDTNLTVQPITLISKQISSSFRTIALCDLGAYLMQGVAAGIPPRFYHYISIDPVTESMQICSISENKTVNFMNDSRFSFCSCIDVSSNGMFVVLSYTSGYVQVYRIVHHLKKPTRLESVSMFSLPMKCYNSVMFSINFICASAYSDNKVYLWNYSTKLLHRVITPGFEVIGMFADESEGVLTIYGQNDIVQYTLNAIRLRGIKTEFDITVARLFAYTHCFDGRIVVTGDTRGFLTFFQVDESTYSFKIIGSKPVHKHPIVSLFVSVFRSRMVSIDTRNNTFVAMIDINDEDGHVVRCAFCDEYATTKCAQCGIPLCANCISGDVELCPNCACDHMSSDHSDNGGK